MMMMGNMCTAIGCRSNHRERPLLVIPQTGSDAHWGHHKSLVPVSAVHDGEKKFVNDRVVLQTAVQRCIHLHFCLPCLVLGHREFCQFFQMNYLNKTESWFDFQISSLLMHLSLSNWVKFRGVAAAVHRGVGFLTRKRNQLQASALLCKWICLFSLIFFLLLKGLNRVFNFFYFILYFSYWKGISSTPPLTPCIIPAGTRGIFRALPH